MKTPVALVIFNRPNETRRVFETIRAARPQTLLVFSDGPRSDTERILCEETRAIIDSIDWPCDVHKNYADTNIGCRQRLASGLAWVFETVDRAIILEADCLPHSSFFTFCEELLERYADDPRVMHISGNFFQQRNPFFASTDSYYFSILPHIWGWATWRRAWKHYDADLTSWPRVRADASLRETLTDPAVYEYWEKIWDDYYAGKIDSWDGQWTFACLMQGGLSINPTVNLVSNIGFGTDAMHTKNPNSIFANVPVHEMTFPLKHPYRLIPDTGADAFTWKQNFGINAKLRQQIFGPIRRQFPTLYAWVRSLLRKKL